MKLKYTNFIYKKKPLIKLSGFKILLFITIIA